MNRRRISKRQVASPDGLKWSIEGDRQRNTADPERSVPKGAPFENVGNMAIESFADIAVGSRVWFTKARGELYGLEGAVVAFSEILVLDKPGVLFPRIRLENGEVHFALKPAELTVHPPEPVRARRRAERVNKTRGRKVKRKVAKGMTTRRTDDCHSDLRQQNQEREFHMTRMNVSGDHDSESSVMQDDLAKILNALGLGDHARPLSPHGVVINEVLPAIHLLTTRANLKEEAKKATDRKLEAAMAVAEYATHGSGCNPVDDGHCDCGLNQAASVLLRLVAGRRSL